MSNFATIPTLQGLRKDHKGNIDNDAVKGPKLRPLAAANRAPNAALGSLIASIAKAVGDSITDSVGAEVVSTEQLKHDIQEMNNRIVSQWETDVLSAQKNRRVWRSG